MGSFDLRTISIAVVIALIVGAGAGYMVGNSPVSNLIEQKDGLEAAYNSLFLDLQSLEAELDSTQELLVEGQKNWELFRERYLELISIDQENQVLKQQVIDLETEIISERTQMSKEIEDLNYLIDDLNSQIYELNSSNYYYRNFYPAELRWELKKELFAETVAEIVWGAGIKGCLVIHNVTSHIGDFHDKYESLGGLILFPQSIGHGGYIMHQFAWAHTLDNANFFAEAYTTDRQYNAWNPNYISRSGFNKDNVALILFNVNKESNFVVLMDENYPFLNDIQRFYIEIP